MYSDRSDITDVYGSLPGKLQVNTSSLKLWSPCLFKEQIPNTEAIRLDDTVVFSVSLYQERYEQTG